MDPADRQQLTWRLDEVRQRWLRLRTLTAAPRAILAVTLVLAAAALGARWTDLSDAAALVLFLAAVCLCVAGAAAILWRWRRAPDDRQVARYIEERCPGLDDQIVAAVDAVRRDGHGAFAPLVVRAAAERLSAIDPSAVVDRERARPVLGRIALASVALALAVLFVAPLGRRAFEAARLRFFPGSIAIGVTPGDARIISGRPVTIAARLQGRGGTLTRVTPVVELRSQGQVRTVPMVRKGESYELNITGVDRTFGYRVLAGRARSSDYTITALFAPRLDGIDLHYEYPAVTRLAPRDEQDGGDIYAPVGTRVRLRARADKPVAAGQLTITGAGSPIALTRVDDRTFESTLTLRDEGAYRVALADADGLRADSVEYFIRLVTDRPPEIHIVRPGGDQRITPLEEVTIEARADDDYGIASIDMVYAVAGGPEHVVPFTTITGGDTAKVGTRLIAAEDLGVKPGDVISYYARARDVPHAKASSLAHSEIFFLEVQPFNEEYSLAESQAMAGAAGTELESLIAAQKEVISATWNLERRGDAGRSATDAKAVATAEAEVKGRTEKAAGVVRPGRRGIEPMLEQLGMQTRPPSTGDHVGEAAAAMGRAVTQLNAGETKDAIAHEMSALNALLKAQADIRQRQVAQRQNGSNSFGNGRQGQDLSTLFDRELKRQQRTNYETGSKIEQPQQASPDRSALDRIRDLARRQEELSAQQKALANANLSADEIKRQLEKLTREQEQLRRELDESAQRLNAKAQPSAGAQGAASPGGASSSTQAAVRDALDQMRRAMSELERQQPGAAADRGAQAARQLRTAEGQMQGNSPDARRQQLGELQLESQQVAEAERRLSSEAERLRTEGSGSTDTKRRLAGEQQSLADRIAAVQERAKQLGADPQASAQDRSAAAAAATAIESGHLADRMRASAEALRSGSGRTPATEQQLADALEDVARQMAGASAGGVSGDTQKLAGQLDALRDARERLARMEKRLADLERQAARQGQSSPQSSGGTAARRGGEGRQGEGGAQSGGAGGSTLDRARDDYAREVQRTQDLMQRLQRGNPDSGQRMSTPEEHEWSRSAPGTEAWKQDFSRWESLGKDLSLAIERYEGNVAQRLAKSLAQDRLKAGGSERVPDEYDQRIARYYESLATVRRR